MFSIALSLVQPAYQNIVYTFACPCYYLIAFSCQGYKVRNTKKNTKE